MNCVSTDLCQNQISPRPPLPPYLIYALMERECILNLKDNLTLNEVLDSITKSWESFTDKQKYIDEAERDKQRYKDESPQPSTTTPAPNLITSPAPTITCYTLPSSLPMYGRGGKKAKKQKAAGPKRPKSSYIIFCNQNRENIRRQFPECKLMEITNKLGSTWKALSASEKQPYIDEAMKDKQRYIDEMSQFSLNYQTTPLPDPPTQEKTKKTAKPRPPCRPLSPYFVFMRSKRDSLRKEDPSLSLTDICLKLGTIWRDMPEADRQVYMDEASKDKQRFGREMEEYIRANTPTRAPC